MYSNVYSCCIFSTQARNIPYFIVCFHYFTRPTDFSPTLYILYTITQCSIQLRMFWLHHKTGRFLTEPFTLPTLYILYTIN